MPPRSLWEYKIRVLILDLWNLILHFNNIPRGFIGTVRCEQSLNECPNHMSSGLLISFFAIYSYPSPTCPSHYFLTCTYSFSYDHKFSLMKIPHILRMFAFHLLSPPCSFHLLPPLPYSPDPSIPWTQPSALKALQELLPLQGTVSCFARGLCVTQWFKDNDGRVERE